MVLHLFVFYTQSQIGGVQPASKWMIHGRRFAKVIIMSVNLELDVSLLNLEKRHLYGCHHLQLHFDGLIGIYYFFIL